MLRILIAILLFVILPAALQAQKAGIYPRFAVVKMADKLKYSKDQLNRELVGLSTKEEVKKLLKSRQLNNGRIVFKLTKTASDYVWWTVNLSSNLDIEDDHIVLQTRNVFTSKFYKLDDFKALFRDTLVLLDTLAVQMYIHNASYPDNAYQVRVNCDASTTSVRSIPLNGNQLLFTPQLLNTCEQTSASVDIFNTSNPDRNLSSCNLIFLKPEDVGELEAMGRELMAVQPDISSKDISANLSSYISKHYGTVYLPQFTAWIKRTLAPAN